MVRCPGETCPTRRKTARDGVQVDALLAKILNQVLSEERIKSGGVFAEFKRVFGHPDQRYWEAGDRLIQKDLAKTLELIANEGAKAFTAAPLRT